MIDSQKLLQIIKYNHFSLQEISSILQITPEQFKKKLEKGQMLSNEIEILLHVLRYPFNPQKIFFTTYNEEEPTKIPWEEKVRKFQSGDDATAYVIHRP